MNLNVGSRKFIPSRWTAKPKITLLFTYFEIFSYKIIHAKIFTAGKWSCYQIFLRTLILPFLSIYELIQFLSPSLKVSLRHAKVSKSYEHPILYYFVWKTTKDCQSVVFPSCSNFYKPNFADRGFPDAPCFSWHAWCSCRSKTVQTQKSITLKNQIQILSLPSKKV